MTFENVVTDLPLSKRIMESGAMEGEEAWAKWIYVKCDHVPIRTHMEDDRSGKALEYYKQTYPHLWEKDNSHKWQFALKVCDNEFKNIEGKQVQIISEQWMVKYRKIEYYQTNNLSIIKECPAFTSDQLFKKLPEWFKEWIKHQFVGSKEESEIHDIKGSLKIKNYYLDLIEEHFPNWLIIWSEMLIYLEGME